MQSRIKPTLFLSLLLSLFAPLAAGQQLGFSLMDGTPVGSWQVREETVTDHKGRQTVNVVKTSLLSEEMRDGEKHYWMEMVIQTFKIKKDKRKPSGDKAVMKTLVAASAMQANPANVVNNLSGFGKDIIMQSGDSAPMRITGAGLMADSVMKATGTKVNYDYQNLGQETVEVPAGSFKADKIQGSGTTTAKVLFKKVSVQSDDTAWISAKVPFGLVKGEGTTTTNGKQSTHKLELLEFGQSGAVSEITGEPQELPSIKDMFGT